MSTERPSNVYRAREVRTGKIKYLVGRYSDGRFFRSLTAEERRLNGSNMFGIQGSFSYVEPLHETEAAARSAAYRRWGYSKVEDATNNLGKDYENHSRPRVRRPTLSKVPLSGSRQGDCTMSNTIIERTYQAKEREEGAAFILYALAQREQFIDYNQLTGGNQEEFIADGGDAYRYDRPTQEDQDSVRELMEAAYRYFAEGYRLQEGPRRVFGLTHEVPDEALAWRLVPAGHIATSEAWRLQYVVKL